MNRQEQYNRRAMSAADDAIRKLSAELVRLVRLPYRSWANQDKIRTLDKQIEYLEEVLAAFERDKKAL